MNNHNPVPLIPIEDIEMFTQMIEREMEQERQQEHQLDYLNHKQNQEWTDQ